MKIDIFEAVFHSYAFYTGILVVKMLLMSLLTAVYRHANLVFISPEDTSLFKKGKVSYTHPDIERIRRAHLNDLENILPFFVIGLLYCFTNPDIATANLLFKTFAGARIAHTLVYAVFVVPQPSRGVAFSVGHLCNIYMTIKVIAHFA